MKKPTQIEMAAALNIKPGYMSQVMSGKHPISRPLAEKLEAMFPETSYHQWRMNGPDDIRAAFEKRSAQKQSA
jgi:transcriptional regulator with XRE-family HTH domain